MNKTLRRKTLGVALACALAFGASARAEIFEQILVKVNGEIFTKTDLENRQVATLRQKGVQADLKTEAGNAELKKQLDDITPGIMVDAVDEMLIVQRGKELGYKLSDEQFKSIVDNIRKENKLDTEALWEAALKQENMTLPELRLQLERNMIMQRVQQNEVFGKIGVSEDEAREYYTSHLSEFTTPPTVTLREILVAVPTDGKALNVAADDAAKEKADGIRARALTGEAFDKLASEQSDAPSRANAGLIGPLSLKDLSGDMQKLIGGMKVGGITDVFRTPRGYQILKLESSTKAETMPFEQARERISDQVFTTKRKAEFQKYLEKLRAEAIIEWKNPEIQKAYNAGIAEQAKLTGAAATPR